MLWRIAFAILFLLLRPFLSTGQSRDAPIYKMGFYDFNIGINSGFSAYKNSLYENDLRTNDAVGLSSKMQSSFAGYFYHKNRKFLIADILSAQLGAGALSSFYSRAASNLWLNYRFEFGLGTIYRINANNDIGLNIMLLVFARDDISPNLSASNMTLRYRYKRCLIEAGPESRRELIVGWITSLDKEEPLQFILSGRYLIDARKNVGLTCELLPGTLTAGTESFTNVFLLRLFYGIYF